MRPLRFMALALVAAFATPSSAEVAPDPSDRALPCRPTIACTADLVPPGVIELESGYLYRRLGDGANQSSSPFLLKLTLLEWAQLQLGSNGPTLASAPMEARYFDDITGGSRTYDALLVVYVTKDIGWLHADWNVGVNAWRIEGAPLVQA